jgi:hypothetical protein
MTMAACPALAARGPRGQPRLRRGVEYAWRNAGRHEVARCTGFRTCLPTAHSCRHARPGY